LNHQYSFNISFIITILIIINWNFLFSIMHGMKRSVLLVYSVEAQRMYSSEIKLIYFSKKWMVQKIYKLKKLEEYDVINFVVSFKFLYSWNQPQGVRYTFQPYTSQILILRVVKLRKYCIEYVGKNSASMIFLKLRSCSFLLCCHISYWVLFW